MRARQFGYTIGEVSDLNIRVFCSYSATFTCQTESFQFCVGSTSWHVRVEFVLKSSQVLS